MISFKPVRDNPKNYTLKLWGLQAVNSAAYNGYDPFILHEWQSCSSPRGLASQFVVHKVVEPLSDDRQSTILAVKLMDH